MIVWILLLSFKLSGAPASNLSEAADSAYTSEQACKQGGARWAKAHAHEGVDILIRCKPMTVLPRFPEGNR